MVAAWAWVARARPMAAPRVRMPRAPKTRPTRRYSQHSSYQQDLSPVREHVGLPTASATVFIKSPHPLPIMSDGGPRQAVASPHADNLGDVRLDFFVSDAPSHIRIDAATQLRVPMLIDRVLSGLRFP